MLNGEQIFDLADEAVRIEVVAIRPDLSGRWRPVVPKDVGIERLDWAELSERIVARFAASVAAPIVMSRPARAAYRTQRFIEFVVALANLGDAAHRAASAQFVPAGL